MTLKHQGLYSQNRQWHIRQPRRVGVRWSAFNIVLKEIVFHTIVKFHFCIELTLLGIRVLPYTCARSRARILWRLSAVTASGICPHALFYEQKMYQGKNASIVEEIDCDITICWEYANGSAPVARSWWKLYITLRCYWHLLATAIRAMSALALSLHISRLYP